MFISGKSVKWHQFKGLINLYWCLQFIEVNNLIQNKECSKGSKLQKRNQSSFFPIIHNFTLVLINQPSMKKFFPVIKEKLQKTDSPTNKAPSPYYNTSLRASNKNCTTIKLTNRKKESPTSLYNTCTSLLACI